MRNVLRNSVCLGMIGLSVWASAVRADPPKDEKKAAVQSAPIFAYNRLWEVEVPADTTRIGAADVMGDKKYHLLTLGKDGVLTIHDVSGDKPKEVGKIELGKTTDAFVAGSFLKDKSALIVVEGAYFVRGADGKYTKTLKNTIRPINGFVRPNDKADTVFSLGAEGKPKEFVFLEKDGKIDVTEKDAPDPSQTKGYYNMVSLRLPKEAQNAGPVPEGMKLGGVNILSSKEGDVMNLLTVYVAEGKQSLCIYDFRQFSNGANPDTVKPVWVGEAISGKILDLVVSNSPKDAKKLGVYVLTESKDDAKKHTVTFYGKE